MQFFTNQLTHHGILGMRWGIRRYQNPDGTLTAAGRRRLDQDLKKQEPRRPTTSADDHVNARIIGNKPMSQMSNAELREYTTRMNLEKQYRDMNTRKVSSGRKVVNEVLLASGKAVGTTLLTAAVMYGINKSLNGRISPELHSALFKKKN